MSFMPIMNVPFLKVYSASNTVSFKVPSIESVLPISKVKLSKTITFPLSKEMPNSSISILVAIDKMASEFSLEKIETDSGNRNYRCADPGHGNSDIVTDVLILDS